MSTVPAEPRPNILVFDSGVGGLSVLREIRALLPFAGFLYLMDNDAFPYGEMVEKKLVSRIKDVMAAVTARYRPDLLVIACNTASTIALPHLRASLNLPVVGVVPAIKPAALMSKSKTIALLATNATVNRPYTLDLIAQFASGCRVIRVGSAGLVRVAEAKLRGLPIDEAVIDDALSRLFKGVEGAALDTVVLGCTHFPLVVDELAARAPRPVSWIDSGGSVARRVQSLLPQVTPTGSWTSDIAVFTGETPDIPPLVPALAGFGFHEVHYL